MQKIYLYAIPMHTMDIGNDKLSEVITKASTENVDEVSFVRGIIHSIEKPTITPN